MGDVRSHGSSNGDNVDDLCDDGDGDGMHNEDASVMAMDGLTTTVVGCTMPTALDGKDGDATVTTAMDGLMAIEEVEDYNGICFMMVKILDALICRGTSHKAK
jgi:hypothetical protein